MRRGHAGTVGAAKTTARQCTADTNARGKEVDRLGSVVGETSRTIRGVGRSYGDNSRDVVTGWVKRRAVVVYPLAKKIAVTGCGHE